MYPTVILFSLLLLSISGIAQMPPTALRSENDSSIDPWYRKAFTGWDTIYYPDTSIICAGNDNRFITFFPGYRDGELEMFPLNWCADTTRPMCIIYFNGGYPDPISPAKVWYRWGQLRYERIIDTTLKYVRCYEYSENNVMIHETCDTITSGGYRMKLCEVEYNENGQMILATSYTPQLCSVCLSTWVQYQYYENGMLRSERCNGMHRDQAIVEIYYREFDKNGTVTYERKSHW